MKHHFFASVRTPTRTQILLGLAALVVVAGGGGALLLHQLHAPERAIGPLPAAALRLPSDVRYVAGIDLESLSRSPLRSRIGAALPLGPDALERLRAETGLDLHRDLTHLVFAGEDPRNATSSLVAVLLRPGHAPIGPWLRAQPLRRYSHEGATIFILATKRTPQVATLLGPDLLVIGFPDPVEHAAAEIRRSSAPLGENQVLLGLLEGLRADAPLWLAYELRARARPDGLSEDVARAVAQLTTLTMTGQPQAALDLEFTATAETPDAAAALGRLVGQLAGFAPYAAGENRALLDLARSLRTVQQERQLLLSARVPYALLDGFPQQLSLTSALPGGHP